jgi:UDP:flavonoid glycosyltransferase YjiC (YdhE family)
MGSRRRIRVLAVALGSSGDVNPILGIARGLLGRGHEVFVLANEAFKSAVTAMGAAFEPLGSAALYEAWVYDPRSWRWPSCVAKGFKEGWIPAVRPTYERIAALAKPGETLVLAGSLAVAAWIAKEKLGLPLVAIHASPMMLRCLDELPVYGPMPFVPGFLGRPGRRLFYKAMDWVLDRWLAPGVNEFRKSLGLRPVKGVFDAWVRAADKVVGVWPEWYFPPQSSWPPRTSLAGFVGYDRGDTAEPLDEVTASALAGPPPVLVTCGSSMSQAGAFFAAASLVPAALGRPVLFVSDRRFVPPTDAPPGVTHVSYVPFSRVLPKAAAIVHHGGIGTAAAALQAGIPQVVVPLAFDQFDNAYRFEKLGVARRLSRWRLSARTLAGAVGKVLESPAMGAACRRYAGSFDPEQALKRACDVVEATAG